MAVCALFVSYALSMNIIYKASLKYENFEQSLDMRTFVLNAAFLVVFAIAEILFLATFAEDVGEWFLITVFVF